MRLSGYPKIFSVLAVFFLLLVPVLTNFLPQNSQPTPSPSPLTSPSVSPTPSPVRSPSPTPLPGAQNFHQWGSITLFNGLPSDSIRAISQTLDGVMWFGTDNGLARFDGRRIQNFSLGSTDANRVSVLKTAPTGQLWIGTRAGAFVYSENGFQPVEGTQNVGITAILLGPDVFFGTDTGLVFRVKSNETRTFTAEKLFSDPIRGKDGNSLGITSMVEHQGKLLVGTPGGGVFIVKYGSYSEFHASPRPAFVNSLACSETGNLWLGADAGKGASGIYMAESGSRAIRVAAPTANVLTLEVNEGGLWAGTERNGLFHISESKLTKTYTFENTSGGLRSDTIYTLFTDREGVIWIGTNRGVSRFDRYGAFQETVSDVPNSNFVRALFSVREDWTLAGSNRGLFLSEGKAWKPVPGFDGKIIYSIAEHKSTELMIGTSIGLFTFSGKLIVPGDVRMFANSKFGTYAAVFGRGVIQIPAGSRGFGLFDPTLGQPPVIYPNVSATSIVAGVDKLWIGTAGLGLFSFDGQTVKSEVRPDALKSGTIWKMFNAADGILWIAGEHGVFRLINGQSEKIIEVEDVRDVFVDREHIWAATTTRGLLHARHDERFGWLVSSVGFEQGLPSEKAFSILPVKEALLIATNRGVVTYKPGSVAPKLIPTRILSQRVHDLGELKSTIELDYPQNSLLIEVAGQSSRTFPEEFQYTFVLTNAKGEIIDSRLSKDAQYAPKELSPGEYDIESKAFDRDLNSSEPLLIRFSVAKAPFPWTATALGVLLAMALVGLVWAVVERRRIVIRNRELAAARLDLANEAERERRRIARDLHDQTLADLRNLMMMNDKLSPTNAEFRDEIESISTEVRRICEDLSPSVLENVGLVAALEFLLAHTIDNYTFHADETVDEKVTFPINVQLQIYRIVQEILTNIRRHANATLVEMTISVPESHRFELVIADNGIPFSPSDNSQKSGRGVANIRSRASLIRADIDWQTNSNDGNRFWLRIFNPT